MKPAAVALLLCALLVPVARADEALGIQLVREAQARMAAGDTDGALELLEKARTEWPGSPVVSCTRGDALLAAGRVADALGEYDRALNGPEAHHARFNRAVAEDLAGEQQLSQANVPADVAALPEGPQPEMLAALKAARPQLEQARDDFLTALDLRDEPAARESVGALNRRLDALKQIEDELQKRADDQKQKDDQKKDHQKPPEDQQDKQDQQNQDQQQNPDGQPPPDGQPQPQDQQPPDQPQDQQDPKDQKPQDQPQDQPDGQPQPADPQPSPQSARELSEEEVQRLLDRLARLEDEARERAKAREMASRRAVEKDW